MTTPRYPHDTDPCPWIVREDTLVRQGVRVPSERGPLDRNLEVHSVVSVSQRGHA